ncbi:MAG: replicative DNA helicase, partial [Deltaproteobacteria bacterium]
MPNDDLSSHKLPPQNLEAEQSILGGILIDNDAIDTVIEILTTQDFYKESHKKIFDCMAGLSERSQPIDIITLTEELKKKNILDEIGGISYIGYLTDSVPTAANIRVYAKIVKEKAILRKLISTATEIATKCYETEGDAGDLLDQAEKVIFEISENKIRPSFFAMREIVKDSFKTIESLYERKELITGVPTGFKDLDKLTAGLQPSDLIVVAGRPSMGKTAFCLNIAQYAAIESKIPVAVFSLEMAKEQLAIRMLCSEARVNASNLRGGYLSESDWPKLTMAAGHLSDALI